MSRLAFTRTGAGPTLILLHALGLSRHSWDPVVPALSKHFDVIAVDLPGCGDSPMMPPDVEPRPAALAAAVAGLLDELHIEAPHIAGNSLGGWVALELAGIHKMASLTLLSPAGLWRHSTPLYCLISLRATRWLCRHAARLLGHLVNHRLGRVLVLGQSHGRAASLSPDYAHATIRTMAACPGFDSVLSATAKRHYVAEPPVEVPVTIAFGSRDLVLLSNNARYLGELPPGTSVRPLPGCGHIPMTDDPNAVAALISSAVLSDKDADIQTHDDPVGTDTEPNSATASQSDLLGLKSA
jgi:pimeloyl-ACP methyl ester carboxylesterase